MLDGNEVSVISLVKVSGLLKSIHVVPLIREILDSSFFPSKLKYVL